MDTYPYQQPPPPQQPTHGIYGDLMPQPMHIQQQSAPIAPPPLIEPPPITHHQHVQHHQPMHPSITHANDASAAMMMPCHDQQPVEGQRVEEVEEDWGAPPDHECHSNVNAKSKKKKKSKRSRSRSKSSSRSTSRTPSESMSTSSSDSRSFSSVTSYSDTPY